MIEKPVGETPGKPLAVAATAPDNVLVERSAAPEFLVDLLLEERSIKLASGMLYPKWSIVEVLLRAPDGDFDRSKTIVDQGPDFTRYLWTGFQLAFFRDGGESYWHTLVGEKQEIFVVCQEDEDELTTPMLVTADYDEAMAYHEADDLVLSCDMPEAVYAVLERFVLENYAPEQKKRRKRKQWHSQEQSDEPFARRPEKN